MRKKKLLPLGLFKLSRWSNTLQEGLHWLQPPAVMEAGRNHCNIGFPYQFYIGQAHQYIRKKENVLVGPTNLKLVW